MSCSSSTCSLWFVSQEAGPTR